MENRPDLYPSITHVRVEFKIFLQLLAFCNHFEEQTMLFEVELIIQSRYAVV